MLPSGRVSVSTLAQSSDGSVAICRSDPSWRKASGVPDCHSTVRPSNGSWVRCRDGLLMGRLSRRRPAPRGQRACGGHDRRQRFARCSVWWDDRPGGPSRKGRRRGRGIYGHQQRSRRADGNHRVQRVPHIGVERLAFDQSSELNSLLFQLLRKSNHIPPPLRCGGRVSWPVGAGISGIDQSVPPEMGAT